MNFDTNKTEKRILDVGCGYNKFPNAIGIDKVNLPNVDIPHDLEIFPWPVDSESIDVIIMNDIIEHISNTINVIEECYRILKMNGLLKIKVVHCNHRLAFSDPTHVKYFNEFTWEFFTGQKRIYYTNSRFKLSSFEYIWDKKSKKIFRSIRLMHMLSYFLCNIKQGMNLCLIKE